MARRLGLLFVFLVLAHPAWANPCALPGRSLPLASSGIGGTGLSSDGGMGGTGVSSGSGIGGTGSSAHSGMGGTGATAGSGMGGTGATAGSGMGGTGATAGSGMGGTGVVGVITGFGSICVDGLEIHYGANTPVSVDGRASSVGQLAVGRVVAVQAEGTPGSLRARHIDVTSAVVGPVASVAPDGQVFTVLGQEVRIPAGTKAPGVGEFVGVDGFRDAGGEVQATHIQRLRATGNVSVTGVVTSASSKTTHIGALTAVGAPRLQVGTSVRLAGRLGNGGVLEVREVDIAPQMHVASKVGRMVLQGIVNKVDPKGISLGYARVEAPRDAARGLEVGQWIRVEVERRPDGGLDVHRLLLDVPRVVRAGAVRPVTREANGNDRELGDHRESAAGGQEHDGQRVTSDRGGHQRPRRELRGDKPERAEAAERAEVREVPERPERVEVPERVETPERPERIEVPETVERPERVERYDD